MNKLFILALIAVLCGSGALHAQDIIVLKSGGELRVTDIRITATEVLFNMYDFPPGETVSKIEKSRISMIKYKDGRRETFNEQPVQSQQYGSQQQQYDNQQQNRNQQQYDNQQQNRPQQQYETQRQDDNQQPYGNQRQYRNQQQDWNQQQYDDQQPYRYQPSGWWKFNIGLSFPKPNIAFPFPPFDRDDLNALNNAGIDLNEIFGKGYGAGLKYYNPLGTSPNFSLVYGAEFYYHGLNSDTKDKMEQNYYGNNADVTYPMYFNLPVTIGGNFTVQLPNTNTSIYGEASAGLNVSYLTKGVVKGSYDDRRDFKAELSVEPEFGFCYGLEAGIILNKVYIGVRHNNLGTYKYKYKATYTYSDYYSGETHTTPDIEEPYIGKTGKVEMKNTVLVLGIRF